MSQTETGKTAAADERTEAARSFIGTVKATRRKYTPEEKFVSCWRASAARSP